MTASLMLCFFVFSASPVLAAGEEKLQQEISKIETKIQNLDPEDPNYESQKAALEAEKKTWQDRADEANKRASDRASKSGPDKRQEIKFEELFKCPSWGAMSAINQKCRTCEIMLLFFDAANYMTESVASSLESPMKKLIAVCFGIWLAFQTLKFFSTPASELDPGEFGTNVGKMFVRVALGVGFISGGCSFVFDYLLQPFLDSVAQLVSVVAGSALYPTGAPVEYTGPISVDTRAALDGMIGGFAKPLADMKNVGFGLMCNGFFGIEIPPDFIANIFEPLFSIPQIGVPSPLMIVFGLLIYILFTITAFVYALTFLDVVMRFCLILCMIPIAALAWVFPVTSKYTSQIWRVFLNTALMFLCTAIFLSIIVQLANNALGPKFMNNAYSSNFRDAFVSLSLVENIWLLEHFFINPFPFILVMVIGMIAFMGLKIPEQVAGKLSGLGLEAIENCGRKAVKNIINAIIDIIMLAITICSWGATSFIQALEPIEKSEKAIEQIRKLKEYLDKLKKLRQKLSKVQKAVNKVADAAE